MASDERVSPTSMGLPEDLTRSLEDAFQFTSMSRSAAPTSSSTPVIPHPLIPSLSSSSRSNSGTLLMEHRASSSSSTAPNTPSKSGHKAVLDLERFLDDQTPVSLTNIPLRHSSATLLSTKPKSAPPPPSRSPISTLVRQEDGKLIYTITPSDTLEGLSLRFGIKVLYSIVIIFVKATLHRIEKGPLFLPTIFFAFDTLAPRNIGIADHLSLLFMCFLSLGGRAEEGKQIIFHP